jgi:hypothetical protein
MPQMKWWNGSSWVVPKAVKTWDGSQWVGRSGKAKFWNGSAWVSFQTGNFYVMREGLFQNGITFEDYGNSDGYRSGYNPTNKTYHIGANDSGYMTMRSIQNIDLTNYKKMYAIISAGWGDTGGHGSIRITDQRSQTYPSNNYGQIERYHYEGTGAIMKSIDIMSLNGLFTLILQASANSEGSIDVYYRDIWFE